MIRRTIVFRTLVTLLFTLAIGLSGCGKDDVEPCAFVTCEEGSCRDGVCVNPDSCDSDDVCLEGFVCGDSQRCEATIPCSDSEPCEAGECLYGACVNPDSCDDDTLCLPGFECDGSSCVVNPCFGVTCERGVCDAESGSCTNGESCTTELECLDGFYCVVDECVAIEDACDGGCPGNQICSYDEVASSTTCIEHPGGCARALDCVDARVCVDGSCAAPSDCSPDVLEPNDTLADATDFLAEATDDVVTASLCAGDVDVFTYDTSATALANGTLSVDLRTRPVDVGVGTIDVRVVSEDGSFDTTVSGLDPAPVLVPVDDGLTGRFRIEVASTDITQAGAQYDLNVALFDDATGQACMSPTPLTPGTPASGSTADPASTELGSRCTSGANGSGEQIFSVDVTETSYLEAVVTPASGVDVAVSIREECLSSATEVACASRTPESAAETAGAVVSPGTYFIVVQGPDAAATPGDFSITATATPTVCIPGSSSCPSASERRVCNPNGTGYDTFTCSDGCDSDDGLCRRDPGDVCHSAIDATGGYSGTIEWDSFENDFDPTPPSCISETAAGQESNGPDAVFRVELQPDEVLVAELVSNGEPVSLYAVETCDDIDGSCLEGANGSVTGDERLIHLNPKAVPQEVFVVADIGANDVYLPGEITIEQLSVICRPGERVCSGDDAVTCSATGASLSTEPCAFGCSNGECNAPPNDSCAMPFDLIAAGVFTGPIEEYANTYSPVASGCTGAMADGGDAAFDVTAQPGEVVTVELTAPFDASLSVVTNCFDLAGSCVVGAEKSTANTLEFLVESGVNYYAIVDSDSGDTGDFEIRATTQAQTCVPGTALGCATGTELEYCSALGIPKRYACDGACSNGACESPRATSCIDPIKVGSGYRVDDQPFDTPDNFDPGTGTFGSCDFTSLGATPGPDRVHEIELAAGETLVAKMDSETVYATIYLLDSCGDFDSCLERTRPGSGPVHEIQYTATAAETVYLVTDRVIPGSSALTYDLDIRVKGPCTPGQASTCDLDGETVVFCGDDGFEDFYSCPTTCTAGRCDQGIGETCYDPIEVTMSGIYSPPPGVLTDDVDYGTGIFGGCSLDNGDPVGREAVFAVQLSAGDTLEAFAQSDETVLLLKDCLDRDSCINPGTGSSGYRAAQDETIYIVVETAGLSFTSLNIQITPGLTCAPNSWSCVTANRTALCDFTGLGYFRELECAGACNNGLCAANESLADSCSTAPDVSTGTRLFSSFDRLTNQIGMDRASCVGAMPGPEHVSSVFANEGDRIIVASEHLSDERMSAYIFTDCADPGGSCVAGRELTTSMAADSIAYVAESTGQYFVALDSPSADADEPFGLSIEVEPRVEECTPDTQTCLDASTLQYCTSAAKAVTHTCSSGCVGDACSAPDGDSCREPIVATAGSYTGDFGGTNAHDPGEQAGGCYLGAAASGADTIYAVDLSAGETLAADLQTTNADAYLFLSGDCDDSRSCLVNNRSTGPTTLTYRADADQRIYVIVDSTTSAPATAFTLDLTITPGLVCAPNSRACVGGDVSICNSTGTGTVSQTCANGCEGGYCVVPLAADTCSTAPDAGTGLSVVSQMFRFSDDSSLAAESCLGEATSGPDLFYSVTVAANDVISARVFGQGERVYILSECGELDCLAGGTEARYRAPTAGTYYVAVDTVGSYAAQSLLEIDVSPAACLQGEAQCNSDGVTLEFCDEFGSLASYTCSSSCSSDACDMPTGDRCLEPIAITASGPVSGDFNGSNAFDNDGEPRDAGACFLPDQNAGGDTFYRVDLAAGDTLDASLTATISDPYLFLMERCTDVETCLSSNPMPGDSSVRYRAESAESVILVVDSRTRPVASASYTLDIAVTPGLACAPDSWVCDGGDARRCNASGTGFDQTFACASGCRDGFCDYDESAVNTCSGAPTITGGTRIRGDSRLLGNEFDLSGASCIGASTGRSDSFVAIQANAGEVIHAMAESLMSDALEVFVFDDCAAAEASCYAGGFGGAPNYVADVEFLVPTTGTYYVAVETSGSRGPFVLEVDVSPGSCSIDETQCNGSTLQYCDGASFADYSCSSTCSGGACDAPTGDVCYDAISVASTGTYTGSYVGKTNALDPGNGSCRLNSSMRADGDDTIYAVTMAANELLEADLTTTATGATLYLLDGCAYPTQSCLEFSPGKSLQFFAETAGTYYLVVDSDRLETAGFTLDLTTTPVVCKPGEVTCDPSTSTVTECASDGLSYAKTTVCPEGCDAWGCTGPTTPNDTCASTYTITAPVTLHDSFARFSNTLDPGVGVCLREAADGPEAIYAVPLNAGDRLDASLASGDSRKSIYLLTDCSDPRGTCAGGEATDGSAHSLSYVAPISQTVHVVVDSTEETANGFTVSIDVRTPQCLPGQTRCADPTTLEYCGADSLWADLSCAGGCANGVCASPQGQACADAVTVTDGTSISTLLNGSDTIGGAAGSCLQAFGDGDDNFYAIDLVAGQTLTVTAETPGSSGFDAVTYGDFFVLSDCYDNNTCVASSSMASTPRTLTFVAPSTERYYVVVDASAPPASDTGYTISFDVQ